jgi:molybdenum cofactor cytidylyltransferase
MGASIAAGVRGLQQMETDAAAVAILLADQPLITSQHLNEMRRMLFLSAAKAVAARYDETLGVPALFKRELWMALASLSPSSGARSLLRSAAFQVDPYDLPEAATDLDTPEQYAAVTS